MQTKNENQRTRMVASLIESLKIYLLIKPLQYFCKSNCYEEKLAFMRQLPKGTIGSDLALMLDKKELKLIPKFENHDLKHLILNYGMSSKEELRMQAYLFGNGNYSIFCLLFLASAILWPSCWKELYNDYKLGKKSPAINYLKLKDCMLENTEVLKKKYQPISTEFQLAKENFITI